VVRSSFLVFRSDDAGVDGYMPCLRSRICGDRSCSVLQETRPDRGRLGSSRIGFLRSRGVVLGHTRLMDLIEESHGCRMTRKDTDVNMRE